MISINYGPVPYGTGPYYLYHFTYHPPAVLVISEMILILVIRESNIWNLIWRYSYVENEKEYQQA